MLPLEILEHTASYLPRRDIYYCLMVCREWYFIFLPCLYKTIEISTDANAYDVILEHANESLCYRVHELVLEDGLLSVQEMRTIRKRCVFFNTLHFWWWRPSLLSTLLSMTSPSNHLLELENAMNMNTILFESPVPALTAFGQNRFLTCLKLSCLSWDPPYIFDTANGCNFDGWLSRCLEPMSSLKKLMMHNVLPTLDVRHLAIIHSCCPKLIDLELEGPSRIQYDSSTNNTDNPNGANTIISQLRSLRLVYNGGWSDTASTWLSYIDYCYPNLINLHLENTSEKSSWIILPTTCSPDYLNFSNLQRAQLIRLDINYDIIFKIQNQAPLLYDFSIHGSCIWSSTSFGTIKALDQFDSFVSQLNSNISRLSVTIPEGYHHRLTIFCICENLCDLSLWGSSSNNNNNSNVMCEIIDLPVLLVTCRALRRLRLTHIHLSDELLWNPVQTPIERLELDQVTLTSDVINSIVKYCGKLMSFISKRCYWRKVSAESVIGIHLRLNSRHSHLIQVDDPHIVWATSTYTTIWGQIQVYGLMSDKSNDGVDDNFHSDCYDDSKNKKIDRWLRVASIRNSVSEEKKLSGLTIENIL
ncbi:hypothetical protein INT45_002486 [Circinella minor]|uniref:F-box domain-containing protein n=1 Tax=Circinella minor TaxID=1195481 RepID=A0A8H7SCD1_9FUNG|nr:hypothetical protein INT45_002486 [Circinella minor]